MNKRQRKSIVLARLSASLRTFYPELHDHFLCPTCLKAVSLTNAQHINEAHIVPRSAGGRLATFICASCNSAFGHAQDKWLGEFVRLTLSRKSLLDTRHQNGHFVIGGQRVSGKFEVSEGGGLEFFIYTDCTSPRAMEEVRRLAATSALDAITIPLPILENRHLIEFGLVTSAYLLWFRELGYSWALQRHLDPVRKLMLNPMTATLPQGISVVCEGRVFESPWIGIGTVGGELCLLTGLANRIVFFPPADRHDLYERLPRDFAGRTLQNDHILHFYDHHQFGTPLGVIYHQRIIVVPDVILRRSAEARYLFFPPSGGRPRMMYPITKEELDREQALPSVRHFKTEHTLLIPPIETGRQPG